MVHNLRKKVMQKNNKTSWRYKIRIILLSTLAMTTAQAGIPLWTFDPLTATSISLSANETATVQYKVTNQSKRSHNLIMKGIHGVEQITSGAGFCSNVFTLRYQESCILSLQINGNQLTRPINDGPAVCQNGNPNQCYRPGPANILHVTPPSTNALLTVSNSPLTLIVNGTTGQLTINNTSTNITATNISSNFAGTALNGNVTETGNTCSTVPPGSSCTLTYTTGNTLVPLTNFTIQGTNTNVVTAAISVQSESTLTAINPKAGSDSGGTTVILTGTGLLGTTAVLFDGTPATNVHVVSSTIVTAVTPAHAVGVVNVVINTPAGGATLANSYTYVTPGQPTDGGVIACLNGPGLNLIASTADNSLGVAWGGAGIPTSAQNNINGAANTAKIISVLGSNNNIPYAAKICHDFQIDSQGHTPCQVGNTCYKDWFLPAKDQLACLFTNRAAIGGFNVSFYWTSTESSTTPASFAWLENFTNGNQNAVNKFNSNLVRCVRSFTP